MHGVGSIRGLGVWKTWFGDGHAPRRKNSCGKASRQGRQTDRQPPALPTVAADRLQMLISAENCPRLWAVGRQSSPDQPAFAAMHAICPAQPNGGSGHRRKVHLPRSLRMSRLGQPIRRTCSMAFRKVLWSPATRQWRLRSDGKAARSDTIPHPSNRLGRS